MPDRPTVIHRTPDHLRAQRAQLLAEAGLDEAELRERAAGWQLSPEQQDIWYTIQGIDYLLGGDG
ncbi:hypothetical protein OIU91_06175 [Streptomyces sp. NBC_01456]|uniref:hypothetical protein n=1 Tax=Streptomyces sp. NBC_01456 TaxID=2975868 RepID=UPI002E3403BE|nr:hypothetical protein [Streptomyces sp. NBC_01456]